MSPEKFHRKFTQNAEKAEPKLPYVSRTKGMNFAPRIEAACPYLDLLVFSLFSIVWLSEGSGCVIVTSARIVEKSLPVILDPSFLVEVGSLGWEV